MAGNEPNPRVRAPCVIYNRCGRRIKCQLCRRKFDEVNTVDDWGICDDCEQKLRRWFGLVETCDSCGQEKP